MRMGRVARGVTLYQSLDGEPGLCILPAPSTQPDLFTNESYSCGIYGMTFLNPQLGNMVVTCMMGSGDLKKLVLPDWRMAQQLGSPACCRPPPVLYAGWQPGYYVSQKIFRTADGGRAGRRSSRVTWSGQPVFVDINNGWIVAEKDTEKLVQTTNAAVNFGPF